MSENQQSPACLIFSLEVVNSQTASQAAARLFELFGQYNLPVTWAADLYQFRNITRLMRQQSLPHELAILGDSSWVSPSGNRLMFCRQLSDRMRGARDERSPVTSLVLSDVDLCDHFDLLVKHRISMVRPAPHTGPLVPGQLQPKSTRFGVWQAPTATQLAASAPPGWWSDIKLRRALKRCGHGGGIMHLAVNAEQMGTETGDFGQLERICKLASQQKEQGNLTCLTLQQLAQQAQRHWQHHGVARQIEHAA